MRTFKLEIDMDNIDFEVYGETFVVSWILEKVADNLRDHSLPATPLPNEGGRLFDLTGNRCGSMGVENVTD